MPIYKLNGKTYNIPDDVVTDFENDNPDASISYSVGEKKYLIPLGERDAFLNDFPQAMLTGAKPAITQEPISKREAKKELKGWKGDIQAKGITYDAETGQYYRVSPAGANGSNRRAEAGELPMNPMFDRMELPGREVSVQGDEHFTEAARQERNKEMMQGLNAGMGELAASAEAASEFMGNINAERAAQPAETMAKSVKAAKRVPDVGKANREQVAELSDEIEQLYEEALQKSTKDYYAEMGEQPAFIRAASRMNPSTVTGGYDGAWSKIKSSPDVMNLEAARRSLRDAKRIIAEADHNAERGTFGDWLERSFAGGATRGFGQKLFDVDTWDMGITDAKDAAALMAALDAADEDRELTPSQRMLLDAKAVEMATNAYFGSYVGRGYKAGQVTAESIPFMLEMALNPASSMGKAATNKLARYALKRFGGKVAKRAARIGGDILGSAVMAGTSGLTGVAAETIERMNGDVKFDLDRRGRSVFAGHEGGEKSWGTAFGKSFGGRTIENFSEMVGNYFSPVLGAVGKGVRKGMGKIGLKGVNQFIDNVEASDIAQLVTDFEKHANWNGTIGEYAEEVAGGIMDALILGDQNFKLRDEEGKFSLHEEGSIFNLSDNLDTFLGVALMGGVLSGFKTMGYRTPKYRARQKMTKADDNAAEAFGGREKWGEIRNTIAFGTDADAKGILTDVLSNPDYSPAQKAAALSYANSVEAYRGMLKAEEMRRREKAGTAQVDAETSFDNGYSLETEQEMNDAKNMLDYQREQLGEFATLELLARIDADPMGVLEEIRNSPEWTAEERQHAIDYVNARATYDGMMQRVEDNIEGRIQSSDNLINSRTHAGDGMIHPATMKMDNRRVYIVSGRVAMNENGTANDEQSDESVIVRDAETGKMEFAAPQEFLSLEEPLDAERERQTAAEQIRQEQTQQAEEKINGVLPFQPGDTYVGIDEQGKRHEVTVVEPTIEERAERAKVKATGQQVNGSTSQQGNEDEVYVILDGLEPMWMSRESVQNMVDAYNLNRLRQHEEEKAAKRAEEAVAANGGVVDNAGGAAGPGQTGGNAPSAPSPSAGGQRVNGSTSQQGEAMPMRADGEPDFAKVTPERAHNFIYNEKGYPKKTADSLVAAKLSEAQKRVEQLKKKEPEFGSKEIGSNMTRFDNALAAWNKAMQAAQAEADYWQKVKDTQTQLEAAEAMQRSQQQQQLTEQAQAEEAARQAEVQAKQEEQAERGANNAAPVIREKWDEAPKVEGARNEIVLANNEKVAGRYMLVESGAATPSHNATAGFAKNEGFPLDENGQTVNDRDYERDKDAQQTTRQIAGAYDQRALQTPVVVSKEGVVLSGNGRTMAGELAAAQGTDGAYIDYLKQYGQQYGFTPEQVETMQHPRLVFVPDADMPYTAETFAKFNQQEMKGQSKTEQAVKLGKIVGDDTFGRIIRSINAYDTLGDFYADTAAATQAINELLKDGAISQAQYAEMFDGDAISAQGREILENMLIGKAFESNPDAVREITAYKSMRQSIISALAEISNNLTLGEDYGLENELAGAIDLVYKARKAGKKAGETVSDFARQQNLFAFDEGATAADYTNATLLMLADVINDNRVTRLKKWLAVYNQAAAESASGQADLFAGGVRSREEIINEVKQLLNYGTEEQQQEAVAAATEQRKASVSEDGAGSNGNEGNQPIGNGDFGPIYDQFKGKSKDAINFLLQKKEGEAIGALHHKEIGDIDLVWGEEGTNKSDGYGLAKIAKYHPEVLDNLQEILDEMHVTARSENRVQLESDTHQASVRLTWDNKKKNWLLTAFEKKNSALDNTTDTGKTSERGKRNDTATPQSTVSADKDNAVSGDVQEKSEKSEEKSSIAEIEEQFGLKPPTTGEEFLSNIDEILRSYASREMARLKVWDYIDGYVEFQQALADAVDSTYIDDVNDWLAKRQTKLRKGVEKQRREELAEAHVDNILGLATEAAAAEQANNSAEQAAKTAEAIAEAEAEVDTNPTEAQKEAGNYKKGHVRIDGYDITIENPKGSVRSGVDKSGKRWEVTMNNTYGYIRGTEGMDGDHIDVFLSDNPTEGNVYVVDQVKPDGTFDEHKVMYGFNSIEEARAAYLSNYAKGWKGLGAITPVSKEEFKKWVDSSHRKTKPFAEYKSVTALEEGGQRVNGSTSQREPASNGANGKDGSYGASNKLVTQEQYEELKKRMQQKMRGQMNMGFDPEILAIGTQMAAYHIEAGARKFADFAKKMIADLGDGIRDYLVSFYNGVRTMPEVIKLGWDKDMTPYEEVITFDVHGFDKPESQKPDIFTQAEHIAKRVEIQQQAEEAQEKIAELVEADKAEKTEKKSQKSEEKSPKKRATQKKSVSLQQVADLFGDLQDETINNEGNDKGRENRPSPSGVSSGEPVRRGSADAGRLDADIQESGNVGRGDSRVQGEAERDVNGSGRPAGSVQGLERPKNPKNTRNNHAERGKDYAPTGVDARIEANIKAIELMQQLMESGEQATPEQMAVLRQFSGWGGLGKAFENYTVHRGGMPQPQYLRNLLGEEAYQQANMSRNSAYYTPAEVIDTLWDIARAMGFKGGKVLEGSAGIGNILGLMPTDMSERSNLQAVEIDPTTGNILKLIYPDAQVDVQGFEATPVENGSVDLAITNVPFVTGLRVNDTTGDKDLSRKFHDIHDFCIAKNIRKLKEGGIGIFITSSGTLDNSAKLREWIVQDGNADVVGAFRLNNETFGGTGATSDIIVVRKRVNGKKSNHAIDVLGTTGERSADYDTGEEKKVKGQYVPVIKHLSMDYNKYFVEHPEQMAGEMHFGFEKGDTFRPTSKALYPVKEKNQGEMLKQWAKSFEGKEWEQADEATEAAGSNRVYESLGKDVKEGSMVVSNGQLCVAQRGKAVPLDVNDNKVKGHTKVECFNAYKGIKDALSAVLDYQTKHESDEGLKPLLKALNKAYDDFVNTYGHLHKNTAISFLRNDVDYPNVFALEQYSERGDIKTGKRIQEFGKTDVFRRRVVDKEKAPAPENVKDAIIASIYVNGRVDVPWITATLSRSTGNPITEAEVKEEIISSGLGFENPASRQMEVSYEYLSGNVREKLEQARQANEAEETKGKYDANIKALEKVIPMNIPAHLIDFSLGSSWLDPKLYEEYVKEKTDIDVTLTPSGGTWYMKTPYWVGEQKNRVMGVRSELTGDDIMGTELIEAAMQNRTITVSKQVKDFDGHTETITDKEATQACANKIDEIRADFKDWARAKMQSDAALSERIEREYNEQFNNYVPLTIPDEFVPTHFGGAATVVDGKPFSLRPHQGKAVVRGTTQPLLLAHEVGTGKTYTLISTAMEMRRLGTAKKPMIVVQNATVGQFVESAKKLYPNAKVLTIEDADRSAEGRKNFYAKIKYNDWDMIVVPQSVFERIPDSEERQMKFVQDKIAEKLLVLQQMRENDPKSLAVRQAEKEIDQLEADLANLSSTVSDKRKEHDEKKEAVKRQNAEVQALEMLDRQTDDVENFDDMGIDALLVDEAHEYKHLGFATAMQRGVKGVDPSYSKKAQGVLLKTQAVLEKNNGRNVIFATGTPISNTAAEIWTFMRYLMPSDTMKEYGIYYFDDFVRNFGNLTQMLEFTTSGKFKENNRFAGYINLPELVRIWSGVSDTVLTREAGGVSDKIPEMENGDKATDIYLPQTKALRSVMKFVKSELEAFDKMSGKEKKENSHIPLTMYGIAKAAAVDARLVVENAADESKSKTNEAVRQTLKSLKETKSYKGTVAIFADNYQNKKSGFNLYEDIRKKLIAEGVPAEQIVIMKSGMSVKKKLEIFDAVNRGDVRVIMGSTFTLGTGVNIQERLHTLIHLDAPNRPMDYTQRNGRILRQGNLHKEMGKPVRVLRFGVEDSLDVTAYQRLKTKGAIADSIMNGKKMMENAMENRALEEEEDVFGDTVAQLSGSEYAMLKNQAEKDVRKYEAKKKQYEADQAYCHNEIPKLEKDMKDTEAFIELNKKDLAKVRELKESEKSVIKVGKQEFAGVEAMGDFLKEYNKGIREAEEALRTNPSIETQKRQLTVNIGGIDFVFHTEQSIETKQERGTLFSAVHRKMTWDCPELELKDVPVRQSLLREGLEDIIDNIISGKRFEENLNWANDVLDKERKALAQMRERYGKPFAYTDKLKEAHDHLDEYTELMKKELEEKEAKYEDMDADVEAASNVVEAEEAEEEETDNSGVSNFFDEGDFEFTELSEESAARAVAFESREREEAKRIKAATAKRLAKGALFFKEKKRERQELLDSRERLVREYLEPYVTAAYTIVRSTTLDEQLQADGFHEVVIAKTKRDIRKGALGFADRKTKKIYLVLENLTNFAKVFEAYDHERQHTLNYEHPQWLTEMQESLGNDLSKLERTVRILSGTTEYEEREHDLYLLSDEALAHGICKANLHGFDDKRFDELEKSFVDILKRIYYEQTNDRNLAASRWLRREGDSALLPSGSDEKGNEERPGALEGTGVGTSGTGNGNGAGTGYGAYLPPSRRNGVQRARDERGAGAVQSANGGRAESLERQVNGPAGRGAAGNLGRQGLRPVGRGEQEAGNPERGITAEEASDEDLLFRLRDDDEPKRTGVGYKVFVLKDGKLYPPMVANPNGEATPVGVWLDADAAPVAGTSKTGRQQVKAGGKGTQGGSGTLAYRPGWHLGEIPYALQFNRVNPETGERELFPKNFVWAEVEYANDVDYQDEAMSYGKTPSGKFQHSLAGLPRVPENGSYRYRTNPNPDTDPWIITGAMKVNRLLKPSEVDAMVRAAGREPQPRQEGAVTDAQIEALNDELTQGQPMFREQAEFKEGQELPIKENDELLGGQIHKSYSVEGLAGEFPSTMQLMEAFHRKYQDHVSKLSDDGKSVVIVEPWSNVFGGQQVNGSTSQQAEKARAYQERKTRRAQEAIRELAQRLGLDVEVISRDAAGSYGTNGTNENNAERRRNAKGWYSPKTKKVVVVLDNHRSVDDLVRTLLHEGVGHHGLRELFGDQFDDFLDKVYYNASEDIRRRIVALAAKRDWNFRRATEEYLAGLTEEIDFENPTARSWFRQVKHWFIELLQNLGLPIKGTLTDNELRYILWRSYKNLEGRAQGAMDEAEDIAMQYKLGVGAYEGQQVNGSTNQRAAETDGKAASENKPAVILPEKSKEKGEKSFPFGENFVTLRSEQDKEAVSGQRENLPHTAAWRDGVDDVMVHTTLGAIREKYGDLHERAKAGDIAAAVELVEAVVKKDKVKALAELHPKARVAFVHAEEATGINQIPAQYAGVFEDEGLQSSDIVQVNKPAHTGSDKVGRLIRRARFDGDVVKGAEYIIVDDHVTMGGTLRDLKDYIESQGGKVVAVSTLTASAGGTKLRPTEEQLRKLTEKGITNEQLKELGIADDLSGLTRSEARELILLADKGRDTSSSQERGALDGDRAQAEEKPKQQAAVAKGARSTDGKAFTLTQRANLSRAYNHVKSKYNDAVVLIDNGDGYVLVNDDADLASDMLGLERKGYVVVDKDRADEVMARLIRRGKRVAVADATTSDRAGEEVDVYGDEAGERGQRVNESTSQRENGANGADGKGGQQVNKSTSQQAEDILFRDEEERPATEVARSYYENAVKDTGDRWMFSALLRAPWTRDARKRFKNKFAESYFDYSRSIKQLQDAIEAAGGKIDSYENVWKMLNEKPGTDMMEMELVNHLFIGPLAEHIGTMTQSKKLYGKKITHDDVEKYVNAKHGPERNIVMATKDAQQEVGRLSEAIMAASAKANAMNAAAGETKYTLADFLSEKDAKIMAKHPKGDPADYTYEDFMDDYRSKDYSGLTEIFGGKKEDGKERTVAEMEAAAEQYCADFEAAVGKEAADELWDKIRALNGWSLRKSYLSGLISKDQYDEVQQMYQYYVPLRGWKKDYAGDIYQYVSRGEPASVLQNALKKAYGRKSQAADIFGTMAAMANTSIVQGNKNIVAQAFLNMALNHQDKGLLMVNDQWYEKRTIDGEETWVPASGPTLHDNMSAEEMQQAIEQYEERMKALEALGETLRKTSKFRKNFPLKVEKWQEDKHSVRVLRNGKVYNVYVLGNPRAAEAFNGLLNPNTEPGALSNAMRAVLRFKAKMQTSLNLGFLVSNFQRDVMTVQTGSFIKFGRKYVHQFEKNLVKVLPMGSWFNKGSKVNGWGIFDLYAKQRAGKLDKSDEVQKMFDEFCSHGGMTGISFITKSTEYERQMRQTMARIHSGAADVPREVVESLAYGIEFLNKGVENATRFAVYMTSRQSGKSIVDSVFDAKEASVNFNMHGSGAWGNAWMRRNIIYSNPALQALRMLGTWYGESKGRALYAFTMTGVVSFATAMLWNLVGKALAGGGGDDDDEAQNDWYALSEWNRYNYINVRNPWAKGYFHWSIPQEMRPAWALGQIAFDWSEERITDERALHSMLMQLNNLTPMSFVSGGMGESSITTLIKSFVPTVMEDFLDPYVWNSDFLGQKITNQQSWNRNAPEWQRAGKDTPQWAIELSRAWNESPLSGGRRNSRGRLESEWLNPSALYYIMTQQLGGFGAFVEKATRLAEEWQNPDEEVELRNIPLVPRFYVSVGDDYSKNRVLNDKFWMYWNEFKDADYELRRDQKDEENGQMDAAEVEKTIAKRKADGSYQRWELIKENGLDKEYDKARDENDKEWMLEVKKQFVELIEQMEE